MSESTARAVIDAARFISAHAAQQVRLHEIATHVGYSPFHLAHLRTLAKITEHEVVFGTDGEATQRSVLDALEAQYPMLHGTIRDQHTLRRRAFIRFYACEQDLSHDAPDDPLPTGVVTGREPFLIIGAMAGGGPSPRRRATRRQRFGGHGRPGRPRSSPTTASPTTTTRATATPWMSRQSRSHRPTAA